VVNNLPNRPDTLRAIVLATIALLLVLPGAIGALEMRGSAPAGGNAPSGLDGAAGTEAKFWSSGGRWSAIVVLEQPCVVQWRLGQELRGADPDGLGARAREYDQELLASHRAFKDAMVGAFPEVAFGAEWTVVLNGIALYAPAAALDWATSRAGVARVEQDGEVTVALAQSVPLINADDLWSSKNATGSTVTGKDVVVAVLDTGIDYSHPDLGGTGVRSTDLSSIGSGTHNRIIGGWNFATSSADFWDGHGHGTHCAGIVGANGTVKGVAPDVKFRIYKVLSDAGWGSDSWVISGVEAATDPDDDGDTSDHSDVISMSLGGFGHPDDSLCEACDDAQTAGVLVAVAASNEGPDYETLGSPGSARKVVSVGAMFKDDSLVSFSSIGPSPIMQIKPDVTAPGVYIYSTYRNNGYATMSGTSMATPHVAGAAALLIQSHPSWTSDQVKQSLMGTAKETAYNAYRQGTGRIDALAANNTVAFADPPSVSLGRLSSTANSTEFTINFRNAAASKWTNGTLSLKLRWALTPLYEASGNATDLAATMLKANTTSVNITPGSSFKVKVTVGYDAYEHVGHYLGEAKLTVGGASVRVPIAFYLRSAILLVDDDNTGELSSAPFNNHNPDDTSLMYSIDSSVNVADALVDLAQPFDVIAPLTWYDGPTKSEMSHYRLVIWDCGYDYAPYGTTLTANDRTQLKSFTDGGGKLWLLGSLVLYDLYGSNNLTSLPPSDFARAVMGVGAIQRHSGTPDPIKGAAGTFAASVSYDVSTTFGGYDYGQNVTPADDAFQVLHGSATDLWGATWTNVTSAIARDPGGTKTLLFAFEFGQLASSTDRKVLAEKVLTWFDIAPHGKVSYSGTPKEGTRVAFSASVTDPRTAERYAFDWDFEYGGTTFTKDATGAEVGHVYVDDGSYTLALRVRETRTGLNSPLVTASIIVVNSQPEAHISTSSPGEENREMSFWGNVTDAGVLDTHTWEWDFDYDGTTFDADSTDRNTTHTYLDDGSYTMALRVTDDGGLQSAINTSTVLVRNLPPMGDIFTPGTSDEGKIASFTATTSDPSPLDTVTCRWDFEYDGQSFKEDANGTRVDHVYLDDGIYTVMMRVTDEDGGMNNITLQVTVRNLPPVGSFVASDPVEEGSLLLLNSSVTDPGIRDALTYAWDFDYDGSVFDVDDQSINASHIYLDNGMYTVALRVRDGDGGELLTTRAVTVLNVAPEAHEITVDAPAAEGSPVKLAVRVTDVGHDTFTYAWDFGDGAVSSEATPTHTFDDSGQYTVSVNVTDDDGGWDIASLELTVANVAPTVHVSMTPGHIDENGTVLFWAEGTDPSPRDQAALTYTWNFGDEGLSNERTTLHTYLDDGNFTVTLTVSDGEDVTTFQGFVLVDNLPPSIVASADRDHVLEGESVNFTAKVRDPSPVDTFTATWDFGDGTTSTEASVSHAFVQDGNYIVVLTVVDDESGTNSTTFLVAVANVRPTVTATASSTSIAEGGSIDFSATWTDPGALDEFVLSWDFGDGGGSSSAVTSHTYSENGTYTVIVSVLDDAGGAGSAFFVIDVLNVAPSVTMLPSHTTIDEGGTVVFTASVSDPGVLDVLTYSWDLGDGSPAVHEPQTSHVYVDNGVYRVVLVVLDDDGGRNTSTRNIIVNNVPPTLVASANPLSTTEGKEVQFNATATDITTYDTVSYLWSFGDNTTSTLATTSHVFLLAGAFNVTLIASDDDGGQAIWTVRIEVLPDQDGDGIPDAEDDDRDGDGVKNGDDAYPDDPTRTKSWSSTYLLLLIVVAVVVAVVLYVVARPKRKE